MKVIELLTKIANEERVPLIKYRDKISHWNKEKDRFEDKYGMNTLYEIDFSELNDEVEVIEEEKKIPEKFEIYDNSIEWCCNGRSITDNEKDIMNKINEIIDYINGGTNGE